MTISIARAIPMDKPRIKKPSNERIFAMLVIVKLSVCGFATVAVEDKDAVNGRPRATMVAQ